MLVCQVEMDYNQQAINDSQTKWRTWIHLLVICIRLLTYYLLQTRHYVCKSKVLGLLACIIISTKWIWCSPIYEATLCDTLHPSVGLTLPVLTRWKVTQSSYLVEALPGTSVTAVQLFSWAGHTGRSKRGQWGMMDEIFVVEKTDFRTNWPTLQVVIMQKGVQLQGWSPSEPLTRALDLAGGSAPRPLL